MLCIRVECREDISELVTGATLEQGLMRRQIELKGASAAFASEVGPVYDWREEFL